MAFEYRNVACPQCDAPVGADCKTENGWGGHMARFDAAGSFYIAANKKLISDHDEGQKLDSDKLRYDLVDPIAHQVMVEVLTFGAAKYSPENWRKVPNARARYYAAAIRHLEAWRMGEDHDSESELSHLAHAACCIHFLTALFLNGKKE